MDDSRSGFETVRFIKLARMPCPQTQISHVINAHGIHQTLRPETNIDFYNIWISHDQIFLAYVDIRNRSFHRFCVNALLTIFEIPSCMCARDLLADTKNEDLLLQPMDMYHESISWICIDLI